MNRIKLNGADPDEVAHAIGGVLILHNITDDEAFYSGGDPSLFTGEVL